MADSIKHQAAMASSIKHQRIEHQSEIEVNPPIHLSTTPPPAPYLIAFTAYCARVRVQKCVCVCVLDPLLCDACNSAVFYCVMHAIRSDHILYVQCI